MPSTPEEYVRDGSAGHQAEASLATGSDVFKGFRITVKGNDDPH